MEAELRCAQTDGALRRHPRAKRHKERNFMVLFIADTNY
jgi:hypothetical protein